MNTGLSALQIGLLFTYAFCMSVGQLLFKFAAISMKAVPLQPHSTLDWLLRLLVNPYFVAAAAIYVGLSIMWVWLLGFTPLSRAYPFVALAFVVTPLLGHAAFSEPLAPHFYLGMALVVVGLLLVIR